MSCPGHGIGAWIFMARLGRVGSLELKWKSEWNDIETNQNKILKY